ncbi:MCE family protein [Haloechinothrix salitolerans]|uniref:MCE family protein n=1 Tax=Haloechinothrix salitolerans TaxID=926830 RepID=A0ABW2CAV7_9PSEU
MKSATHVTGPLVKLIIFVAVTVLTTAVLGISIANINMSDANSYTARFTDATLLLENDDVRIAGVQVGQVTEINVVDKSQAEVTFEVNSDLRLPETATAAVRYRNLVGQRYIALDPGARTDNTPLLPTDGTGHIPLENTQPALDLTELFNGFKPLFTALSPKDVNQLSYEIIQVLQGEGGTMENLLAHTASLTTSLAEKDQIIGEVITNLNDVLQRLNEKSPELRQTIDTLQQLVSGLAKDAKPIGDAIEAIDDLSRSTAGLVGKARRPLKQDIAELGKLTKTLNKHEDLVEHFITFGPKKYSSLGKTASYGSWFNFYLCSGEATLRFPGAEDQPVHIPMGEPDRARCSR